MVVVCFVLLLLSSSSFVWDILQWLSRLAVSGHRAKPHPASLLFPASYRAPRRCFLARSLLLPSSLRFILLLIVFFLTFCPLVASLRSSFILNRVSLSLSSLEFYKPIAFFAPRDAFRRKTPSRCPARAHTIIPVKSFHPPPNNLPSIQLYPIARSSAFLYSIDITTCCCATCCFHQRSLATCDDRRASPPIACFRLLPHPTTTSPQATACWGPVAHYNHFSTGPQHPRRDARSQRAYKVLLIFGPRHLPPGRGNWLHLRLLNSKHHGLAGPTSEDATATRLTMKMRI